MPKRYVKMVCFSLATMGTVLFAGNVYSNGTGAIVGQAQLDGPATAGAGGSNAAMAVNAPAGQSVQMNASSAGTAKTVPTSGNGQKVERDFFRDEGKAAK